MLLRSQPPSAIQAADSPAPTFRRQIRPLLACFVLAGGGLLPGAHAAPAAYPQADPTAQEQYLLQKLNRARLDPAGEGQRLADWLQNTTYGQSVMATYKTNPEQVKSDFAALAAVSPLTFDAALGAAAQAHADDLAAHGGLGPGATTPADNAKPGSDGYTPIAHLGYDGSTPASRAQSAGYTQSFASENVVVGVGSLDTIHAGYLVDWGNPGLDHRHNSMSGNSAQHVVGIGLSTGGGGALIETEDFGYPHPAFNGSTLTAADTPAMLTGVVYHDANGNGQYDVGEGVQGATVTMDGGAYYALTSASGGYALPLVSAAGVNVDGSATVRIQFTDGSSASKTVAVTRLNSSFGAYRSNVEWEVTTGTNPLPAFFDGAAALGQGWSYLAFDGGHVFGYYQASLYPYLFHLDLGWEYVLDAQDGQQGVYLYDFQSGAWWYTSPSFGFPYLYDFARRVVLYYYPASGQPGRYTSGPRWFYDFGSGQIVAL